MILPGALVMLLAAANSQQSAPAASAQKNTTVSLDGCVVASPTARHTFTLDDQGQTYVLKGLNVRDLAGKHVVVSGLPSKRLRVVGGLYPSPNIAAQPNDPTKAAIAAQSGPTSQANKPAVEFNVKSVRVLTGACEAPAK
jgi:hypothetical protein